MSKLLNRLGLALLALSVAMPVFAQNVGSLRGTVKDETGAVIQGVSVTLVNEATKFTRQAVSDAQGGFYFAAVDPGSYTLKIESAGFKAKEIKGIRMGPNDTRGIDAILEVGDLTERIEITADRDIIQTETGAREGLITSEQIESISMIGRNPLELLRVLPGVVAPDQSEMETAGKFSGASGEYFINGLRPQNLSVTLDGSNLRDVGANSGTLIVPNNDMVAEVKVQYSNYAAEFGSSSVNVQAITKGGASEFHGTAYDYIRHFNFAANDFSRNQTGGERPKSQFNYPGFNLSGPVFLPGMGFNKNRDKLFFFIGAELSRQKQDMGANFGVTPTARMRNGDFGEFVEWCADPGNQHLDHGCSINIPGGFTGAGTSAPGGDLTSYTDPMGLQILNLYPNPNYNDPTNRYNYIFDKLNEANRDAEFIRLDYNISDRTRAYVRLARDMDSKENPRGLWWASSGVELPTPVQEASLGRSVVANLTSILSPTTTNEVIVSWSKLKNDLEWKDAEVMMLSTYGLENTFMNPFGTFNADGSPASSVPPYANKYLPQIVVQWSQGDPGRGSMWSANDVDKIFSYNSFMSISDSLTKVFNTHAVKLGVRVERQDKKQNFNNTANVQLVFDGWANGSTGNMLADIAVGRPASADIGTPSAIGTFVAWNIEGFIQDSWKVTKNLTLEYGVRLGKWTNNYEKDDLGAVFLPARYDPSQGFFLNPEETDPAKKRVNGLAYVSLGDVDRNLTGNRPFLVMPRMNFAWDVSGNGSTVVRGGLGVFYNREQGNVQYGTINLPPNAYKASLNSYDISGGMSYGAVSSLSPWTRLGSSDVDSVSPTSLDWPRATTASLSVAKRLFGGHVLEVGYVGTWGRQLTSGVYENVIPAGTLLSGNIGNSDLSIPVNRVALSDGAINAQRQYPTAPKVRYFEFIGESNYHSLQATLSRYTGKFTYLVSYTFSKALGTMSWDDGQDMGNIDPFEPEERSYGILPSDRTHILNASWTWQLGDPIKNGALAKSLLNGWHLSGVSTWYSGQPLRLNFAGDLGNEDMRQTWWGSPDYVTGVMPVFTCDPRVSGREVGDKVLDINCVGIPSYPDSGPFVQPYYVRTPSRMNHDITIYKNFALGGERKLQLRVGAFNVLNQAFPTRNDVDYRLEANCNVRRDGVPNGEGGTADNVCDPTGGYSFTQNTIDNFGKIITKRGHRVIEFAVKLYF